MLLENRNEIFQDIAEFLQSVKNSKNMDTSLLYNLWADKHGIILADQSLVYDAIKFLDDAKSLDKTMLTESYNIDKESKIFSS